MEYGQLEESKSDETIENLKISCKVPNQITEIKPSCSCNNTPYQNCMNSSISKSDFEFRATYEPIILKSDNNAGVYPLFKSPLDNSRLVEPTSFNCKFLNDWMKASNTCKFFTVVAMYNENWKLFHHTLEGILENVESLTNNEKLDIKADNFGAVFIVDGLEPFLKTFYSIDLKDNVNTGCCLKSNEFYFSQVFNIDVIDEHFPGCDITSGNFQIIGNLVDNLKSDNILELDDELAHMFCQKVQYKNTFLNLIFCVKHENKRKLNTHKWFLEGFCKRIDPLYIALLDVGTRPRSKGLYYLFKAMHYDRRVAGCCGEIIPQCKLTNILVMAQMVEYKSSHIFDKAVESHIGYISVLPGAFSAYRWESLNKPELMNIYFKSQRKNQKLDMFQANMYLAEDRILCLELMCQAGRANYLRYVKESVAETDVPETLNELLAQRRRWINGSWFSMIYAIRRCNKINKSGHSWKTRFLFKILMIYYSLASLFSWLLIGSLYYSFTLSIEEITKEKIIGNPCGVEFLTLPVLFLYSGMLLIVLICSFSVKPKTVENLFWWISVTLSLLTSFNIIIILWNFTRKGHLFIYGENYFEVIKNLMIISIPGSTALLILLSCLNSPKESLKFIYGFPCYFFVMGIYFNVFTIYAISNTHDCSWGNRPDKQTAEEIQLGHKYKNERTRWVLVWLFSNLLFIRICVYLGLNTNQSGLIFLLVLSGLVVFSTTIKFLIALFYLVSECIAKSRKRRIN